MHTLCGVNYSSGNLLLKSKYAIHTDATLQLECINYLLEMTIQDKMSERGLVLYFLIFT